MEVEWKVKKGEEKRSAAQSVEATCCLSSELLLLLSSTEETKEEEEEVRLLCEHRELSVDATIMRKTVKSRRHAWMTMHGCHDEIIIFDDARIYYILREENNARGLKVNEKLN